MRLIDATELKGRMMDMICAGYGLEDMVDAVIESPTVDAVPVVRCDGCHHHVDNGDHWCNKWRRKCPDNSDFFCCFGKRKGGDE